MVFGAQWAKPSKGKCGAYEFKPCKQSRSKTDGQTFHVSRYVDYKDKELGADVLNFGDPMGFAMEATKCEGSKKGNPITQCENTLSQGQRWKLMVSAPEGQPRKEWLFDLTAEGEWRDLLAEQPDVAVRLRRALEGHNAEQQPSRWPWVSTTAYNVDRDLSQEDEPDDEFAYWSN